MIFKNHLHYYLDKTIFSLQNTVILVIFRKKKSTLLHKQLHIINKRVTGFVLPRSRNVQKWQTVKLLFCKMHAPKLSYYNILTFKKMQGILYHYISFALKNCKRHINFASINWKPVVIILFLQPEKKIAFNTLVPHEYDSGHQI